MILGSHNSMTYLPPKKWWMYPFRFIAKCQKHNFKEQYENGVRYFDFRLIFKYAGKYLDTPMFCHGSMTYTDKVVNIDEVLSWLNEQTAPGQIYARFIFEKGDDMSRDYFINWCAKVQEKYPKVCFVDARDKASWKALFQFPGKLPCQLVDKYASSNQTGVTKWKGILRSKNWSGLLIDDLWPWIYAKLHNKKTFAEYKEQDVVLLLDFINKKLVK